MHAHETTSDPPSGTHRQQSASCAADVARALCRMVCYNVGHLAVLNAQKHNLTKIAFGGFFVHGHAVTMGMLAGAVRFWSGGELSATFLRHEGFVGAIGALLQRPE
jgi:pantothenate kinase